MYSPRPVAIVSMSPISPRISNSIMSYRYYGIPFGYGEPANDKSSPGATIGALRCSAWCTPGMGVSVGVQVPCRRFTFMSRKIHEDNYESKARASPRGGVCRKPATARRGEEPERQSRLTALGRAGTTQQSPVNQGRG